jgi:predicted RNase H-like nuclease (RuvC/YqgF family)
MIAQQDPYIEKAVSSVYKLSEDERFRLQYEAREDFIRQQIDHDYWYDTQIKICKEKIAEQDVTLAEKDAEIARLKKLLENHS